MTAPHWTDKRIEHFRKGAGNQLWTDGEIAGAVRMLLRTDMNHESVCVAARDRIAVLSRDVHELAEVLQRLLTNHGDYIDQLPGGYGNTDLRDTRALLERLKADRAVIEGPDARRRVQLLQERDELMNAFGRSSFSDGKLRDRIRAIDAQIQEART